MLHVYREPVAAGGSRTWEEDPMVHEFLFHCAASQPCFSPDNSGEAIDSPTHEPVSELWKACHPPQAQLLGEGQEIRLGPEIQLPGPESWAPSLHGPSHGTDQITEEAQHLVSALSSDDGQVDGISDRVTRMDIDSIALPAASTPVAAPAPTVGGHPEEIDEYEQDNNDAAGPADGGRGFCNNIFRVAPEPVLPLPAAPTKKAGNAHALQEKVALGTFL
jgi:hypothetical protein